MKTKSIFSFALALLLSLIALTTRAQSAKLLPQQDLAQWRVVPANYSGITQINDTTYALADDKSATDGFYLINIYLNPKSGKITLVNPRGFFGPSQPKPRANWADCEDLVWVPQSQSLFINHESTGQIKEYTLAGEPTGRHFAIPDCIARNRQSNNGGFEPLAYDTDSQTFWLTTENHLTTDSLITVQGHLCQPLRIVSFGADLQPCHQWLYTMDAPELNRDVKYYAHGVSAMTALSPHRLLILERELSIPPQYLGGKCRVKIYEVEVNAQNSTFVPQDLDVIHHKKLVATFTTHISLTHRNYANYEGMCLGPRLADGRQTLLLINDSQAGAGNRYYTLKDYIKVVILPSLS